MGSDADKLHPQADPVRIDILTPFPEMPESFLGASILGRAEEKGLVEVRTRNLRDWTEDRHRSTDDAPYGGGPGMVMKIEPIAKALDELRKPDSHVVLMSPQGQPFQQGIARELADEKHLIFVCGHYEGVDQRVADHLVDRELSIGDYVLTNGVLPALVVVDAVVRLLPGVLGDAASAEAESFEEGLLDFPQFTRPPEFRGWKVPPELLSGNHALIAKWRREQAERATRSKRPDLFRPPPESPRSA